MPETVEDILPGSPEAQMDWEDIFYDIKDQSATLILGPEFLAKDNVPVRTALYNELAKRPDNGILQFYPGNGIFLFKSEFYKNKAQKFSASYYEKITGDEQILQRIMELPFRLVLNTNPDDLLAKAYKKSGRECQFDYFTWRPGKKVPQIIDPDTDYPLIYNLFGFTESYDSLVLDYEDMFDHLKALLNNVNVPDEVRSILNETNTFIFIGFQLENWSTQLLFRYLNMKQHGFDDRKKNYTTKSGIIDESSESFFRQQFNIKYYGAPVDFLDTIHQKYFESLAAEEEDVNKGKPIQAIISDYIIADEIDKALNYLTAHFDKDNNGFNTDLILVKSQYSRYNNLSKKRLDSTDNLEIMRNKIKESILHLINTLITPA